MTEEFFQQVDKTIKNRERRFKFLMNKGNTLDAISIGEEFLEWINPDNTDDIFYLNTIDMEELYLQKQQS